MKSIDVVRNSQYSAREMARLVFFLDHSHRELVDIAQKSFEIFASSLPNDRTFLINDPAGDWDTLRSVSDALSTVTQRFNSSRSSKNCYISVCSDDNNVSDYSFEYHGYFLDNPRFEKWASFVSLTFPKDCLSLDNELFQSILVNLVDILPFFSAYATLSLEGDQDLVQKIARKFIGLDISSISSIIKDIEKKAPGVFWLNAYKGKLRDNIVAQLNNSTAPASVQFIERPSNALIILLSPKPDRLDVNDRNLASEYFWLAKNLAACDCLHIPRKVTYFDDEDDKDAIEAQESWHLRFITPLRS